MLNLALPFIAGGLLAFGLHVFLENRRAAALAREYGVDVQS